MLVKYNEVIDLIKSARIKAFKIINKELIELYWNIGEYVSEKVSQEGWGKSSVAELARFIANKEPDIKGFSPQNIWRMKQFFETYKDFPKLSTLLREITWSANLHILSKTKSIEEKEFYLRLAIESKLSVRELEREIDSCYFERTISSNKKLSTALRELYPKANSYFKDTYILDFLNLPDEHSEFQLKKGIVNNLKKFLLEIGKDFTFIGEEYPLQVGSKDYFVDLLFFHRELSCLVAFELKIDDFKPEYLGKLNFYLEALDKKVKKEHEKPSVGILLCKSKDLEVVEYALNRTLSPTLVAEYNTKLIDKAILQMKLNEFYETMDNTENSLNTVERNT